MPPQFVPILVVVAVLLLSHAVNRTLTSRFDYRCGACDELFSLSPWVATIAPHRFGGYKYARCPRCGSFAWMAPVPKERRD